MKTIHFIIIAVLIVMQSTRIVGQTYKPMLDDNFVWTTRFIDKSPGAAANYLYSYRFYNQDSIINGYKYKMLFQAKEYGSGVFNSFLREENKRIYCRHIYQSTDSSEKILYDFNLVEGDTFVLKIQNANHKTDTFRWKIISIDSIKVPAIKNGMPTGYTNGYTKRFTLRALKDSSYKIWLAGIGSLNGPLDIGYSNINQSESLICYNYFRFGAIWGNGTLNCEESVAETSLPLPISLFPNPASDYINVGLASAETGYFNYRICNISGQLKGNGMVSSFNKTIHVGGLNAGLYHISLVSNDNCREYISTFIITK